MPVITRKSLKEQVQQDLQDKIYNLLKEHYPEKVLGWVKKATWVRTKVPLSEINMSRRPGGRNMDKVKNIAKAIEDGKKMEPVVLVKQSSGRYQIADGYHRTLGFQKAERSDIEAYAASGVGDDGPWDEEMHAEKLNVEPGKKASVSGMGIAKLAAVNITSGKGLFRDLSAESAEEKRIRQVVSQSRTKSFQDLRNRAIAGPTKGVIGIPRKANSSPVGIPKLAVEQAPNLSPADRVVSTVLGTGMGLGGYLLARSGLKGMGPVTETVQVMTDQGLKSIKLPSSVLKSPLARAGNLTEQIVNKYTKGHPNYEGVNFETYVDHLKEHPKETLHAIGGGLLGLLGAASIYNALLHHPERETHEASDRTKKGGFSKRAQDESNDAGLLARLGVLGGTTAAGAGIGYLADRRFKSLPMGVALGGLLGLTAGAAALGDTSHLNNLGSNLLATAILAQSLQDAASNKPAEKAPEKKNPIAAPETSKREGAFSVRKTAADTMGRFHKMANTLNAAERKSLSASDFGVPEQRRFPMPDKEHARLALQMINRAKDLTEADKVHIREKANRMLGHDTLKTAHEFIDLRFRKVAGVDEGPATESTLKMDPSPQPKVTKDRAHYLAGVSQKQDKKGWYVCTHRARSKSYPSVDAIPISALKFIESTG